MKTIKGFENEEIEVSDFGEWIGKDYIDYKSEYKSNQKLIKILLQENQELKEQLKYLKSGEYLNQLRFERDMLQDVVNKMEVSKEDKKFIDMTHRNTELLEENEKLKEQLEEKETQQKEFIEYLENKINDWSSDDDIDYEVVEPIPQEIFEDVLLKYKKIIGVKDE